MHVSRTLVTHLINVSHRKICSQSTDTFVVAVDSVKAGVLTIVASLAGPIVSLLKGLGFSSVVSAANSLL
jgi:hypothetical protein